MTIAAIEWLRDSAIERGLHNYAQWIDEHMHAAIAAVGDEFMPHEVALLKVQVAELSDQLGAEKKRSADLEQELADNTLAWSEKMADLSAAGVTISDTGEIQMAPAASAPAVEPKPVAAEPSPAAAGTLFPQATEQKDDPNG